MQFYINLVLIVSWSVRKKKDVDKSYHIFKWYVQSTNTNMHARITVRVIILGIDSSARTQHSILIYMCIQ